VSLLVLFGTRPLLLQQDAVVLVFLGNIRSKISERKRKTFNIKNIVLRKKRKRVMETRETTNEQMSRSADIMQILRKGIRIWDALGKSEID
jgi:hypothetical protein